MLFDHSFKPVLLENYLIFKMGYTTIAKRTQILTLKDQCMSRRKIAAASGVPLGTVNRICKTRKIEENLQNKRKTGRPHKLGARGGRLIARKVILQGTGTTVEIPQDLTPKFTSPVSVKTVTKSLRRQGFKAGPKTKKPLLSAVHRQKRMVWLRAHRNWTIEDWKSVVFSDESKFKFFEADSRD